jgi:hypothetical protein
MFIFATNSFFSQISKIIDTKIFTNKFFITFLSNKITNIGSLKNRVYTRDDE